MRIPKPGTFFILKEGARDAAMIGDFHGWLYKFKHWDINTDLMIMTSVATGGRVQADYHTFPDYFEEMHHGTGLQARVPEVSGHS